MSSTVTVSIVTQSFAAPAGTVAGGVRVTLACTPPRSAMAVPVEGQENTLQAVFSVSDLAAGSYGIEAQAVDTADTAIGAPATTSVTLVPALPVNVDVQIPASVSAAVS